MQSFAILCQVIIALGIFNVWIIRYGKETNWRGGEANRIRESNSSRLPKQDLKTLI